MAEPVITIAQGQLRGKKSEDIFGSEYFSFQGIPYAKPPTGSLRFKAPVAPDKWNGILDATKEGNVCYARDIIKKTFVGSEDCLFLNVYTKTIPGGTTQELKPVMVWIHGGAFIYGSGNTDLFGPDFLITEDVVVITINYRLGILGFLCLEDPSLEVPGNAAFKDMVMALKWVKKNVSKFNGDPNNVTIFGESAGGASIHALLLSPMAKGLFHKAIAQSGTIVNHWAIGKSPAKEIAQAIGQNDLDEKSILKNLMELPVEEVLQLQEKAGESLQSNSVRLFGPVVEKNTDGSAFLSEHPIEIILGGRFNQVPTMMGFTNAEGMVFKFFGDLEAAFKEDFESHIPHTLGYKPGSKEIKALAEKVKKFYFGDDEPSLDNVLKFYTFLTDIMFVYEILEVAKAQARLSKFPVYLYEMTVESGLNFFKTLLQIKEPGTSHADDLGYLFKNLITPPIQPGSLEEISMKRFVRLWANFARYGNPTRDGQDPLLKVKWEKLDPKVVNILNIGAELTIENNPEAKRMTFLREVYRNSPSHYSKLV